MNITKSASFVIVLLAVGTLHGISGNIVDIHSPEQWNDQMMRARNTLVVVQFHVQWCAYCRMMKPIFVKISEQYPQVLFWSVNVDEQRLIAWKNGIRSVPTYKYFKNATLLDTVSTINPQIVTTLISRLK